MLDFLCIGAQKAGTSWLHRHFNKHPQITFPAGKEVHFWDWAQRGKLPYQRTKYSEKFPLNSELKQGDMTPAYALLNSFYIQEIKDMYPEVRILFILRDPVERAWSAAKMSLDFAQIEPDEVSEDWMLELLRSRTSIGRSDYEATLRSWCASFDQSQIEVLLYDDIVEKPHDLLIRCGHHIGVDPEPFRDIPLEKLQKPVMQGIEFPMSDRIREELTRFYRPKLDSLSDYIDADLSHWLKPR